MGAYRPALDGVRAVAVGGVIAYHLGAPLLPGGFLGVDLFFVLSGYLITGLLLAEFARGGRIDLPAFFARRARRLLPALLVVVGCVAVAARFVVPVSDWLSLRGDVVATLLYAANWRMIGVGQSYFAPLEPSALQHMWSLAIEEQFYVVWPVALLGGLILLRRRPRRIRIAAAVLLSAIACSSVAMIAAYEVGSPTRSYAGTDGRAQQLLLGALLAGVIRRTAAVDRYAAWLAPTALAGTVALMMTVRDSGAFYFHGGATVAAVVFAVLIWAAEKAPASPAGRGLSWRPLTMTGQISYGLYLWHWPMIVFLPMLLPVSWSSPALDAAIVAGTLAAAVLSFRFIERPLRRGRPRLAVGTPRRMALSAASAIAACAALAVAMTSATTVTQRQIQAAATSATAEDPCTPVQQICLRADAGPRRPVVLVVGDSVAKSLDPGFLELARQRHWTYVTAARNGCGLTDMLHTDSAEVKQWLRNCVEETPARIQAAVDRYHPDLVIAVSRWELISYLAHGAIVQPQTDRWRTDTRDALRTFARRATASGAQLAMIEVLPLPKNTPDCQTARFPDSCRLPPDALSEATNVVYRQAVQQVPGAFTVSMQDVVCPAGQCTALIDGLVLRYDGIHFSPAGARYFTEHLESRLRLGRLRSGRSPTG